MKAKVNTTEKAAVTITVSAAYLVNVKGAANADAGSLQASQKAQKSLLILGKKTAEEFGQFARSDVREALLPHFLTIYKKAGFDEDYAKQQLSRTISFAFPGGLAQEPKQIERATAQLAKADALDLNVNDRLKLANGKYVVNDKTKEIVAVKTGGSGGANKRTPKETYIANCTNAIVPAKEAKFTFAQMINLFVETAIACEVKGAKEWSEENAAE